MGTKSETATRILVRLEDLGMGIAVLASFLMVVLIAVDVTLRYVANSPLSWAADIVTRYLIPLSFFLAVSQTLRLNEHVRVDLFAMRLSVRARNAGVAVSYLATLAVLFVILWQGCEVVHDAWMSGEESPIGQFYWPTWTSLIVLPFGVLLLLLRVIHRTLGHLTLAVYPASKVGPDIDDLASGSVDKVAS